MVGRKSRPKLYYWCVGIISILNRYTNMNWVRRNILRLFLSKEDLLTILNCLECKEYNVQNRLDPRVTRDDNNSNIETVVEMLDRIEKIKTIVKDQL